MSRATLLTILFLLSTILGHGPALSNNLEPDQASVPPLSETADATRVFPQPKPGPKPAEKPKQVNCKCHGKIGCEPFLIENDKYTVVFCQHGTGVKISDSSINMVWGKIIPITGKNKLSVITKVGRVEIPPNSAVLISIDQFESRSREPDLWRITNLYGPDLQFQLGSAESRYKDLPNDDPIDPRIGRKHLPGKLRLR